MGGTKRGKSLHQQHLPRLHESLRLHPAKINPRRQIRRIPGNRVRARELVSVKERRYSLPKQVENRETHHACLRHIVANHRRGIERIRPVGMKRVSRRQQDSRRLSRTLIEIERTNIRKRAVRVKRQCWIPGINAWRTHQEMIISRRGVHEHRIQEDIEESIARIAVGVRGVNIARVSGIPTP